VKYKSGQKIRLKMYGPYSDYKKHRGEECTIIRVQKQRIDFDYDVGWADGSSSCVWESNILNGNIWQGDKRKPKRKGA